MVALHERVEPIKPACGVGDGVTIDIKPTEPVLDVEPDPDVGTG